MGENSHRINKILELLSQLKIAGKDSSSQSEKEIIKLMSGQNVRPLLKKLIGNCVALKKADAPVDRVFFEFSGHVSDQFNSIFEKTTGLKKLDSKCKDRALFCL